MEFLQARILECIAMPSSRGFSQPRNQTNYGLLHFRRVLYYLSHQGSPGFLKSRKTEFSLTFNVLLTTAINMYRYIVIVKAAKLLLFGFFQCCVSNWILFLGRSVSLVSWTWQWEKSWLVTKQLINGHQGQKWEFSEAKMILTTSFGSDSCAALRYLEAV